MRLHTLTVTAFGPFPREVAVDFDEVCSAGLFLIHGATGAGKTSLLDAICFALFADVPGARTRRGLASDHVVEGARPGVALDFTAGGRRLRIGRSPEFSRPKRRGTGSTRVPAAVALEEWSEGSWRAVSTRHDEVAEVLDDVLGMGLTQFAKVVVLPQGDVTAFLRASPEDRRALLERLFDISTFTGVEDWLSTERRRCAAEVDALSGALDRELDRFEDNLVVDEAPPWRDLPIEELPEALCAHVAAVEDAVLSLLGAADAASSELTRTAEVLSQAQLTLQDRERGLRARSVHAEALGRRDEIAAMRVALERSVAADAMAGHLDALDVARADEERHRRELRAARVAAGLVTGDDPAAASPARADLDDLSAEEARVAELCELIHRGDLVASDLVHASRAWDAAESGVVTARESVWAAERSLTDLCAQRDEAQAGVEAARQTLGETEEAAAAHAAAESAFAAAARACRLTAQVEALTKAQEADTPRVVAARERLLAAQEAAIELRQRRLDGMAAELAAALSDGVACPVCGSVDHPFAAVAGAKVTPEEVEVAEETLSAARDALGELERRVTARLERIATLEEHLGDDARRDPAELARAEAEAAAAVARASTAQRALPAGRSDLAARVSMLERLAGSAALAETELAGARATLAAALEARDGHEATIAELRRRHGDCPCGAGADEGTPALEIHRMHVERCAAMEAVLASSGRLAAAVTRRRDREAAAREAATSRGFDGLDDARAARLEPGVTDRLRARVADHEQLLAVTAATLSEEAVAAAMAAPAPDVEGTRAAERAARTALRQAHSAHAAAEAGLAALRSLQGPVGDLVVRLSQARERARDVKELADAATGVGGGNAYRMRLSSFVLAARLEKVVALANERLQRMGSSRYLLEHSDARVSGGARSGLDLRVLDQWTGRTRETASLSGGESFMVSLALALGLADAVREEAGGYDLGTLFIDEGFGSLDEDSLEQVMGVLDGLREGGRAVGVVSHVLDLRARITHQVVVEKTPTGSDVTVRTVA